MHSGVLCIHQNWLVLRDSSSREGDFPPSLLYWKREIGVSLSVSANVNVPHLLVRAVPRVGLRDTRHYLRSDPPNALEFKGIGQQTWLQVPNHPEHDFSWLGLIGLRLFLHAISCLSRVNKGNTSTQRYIHLRCYFQHQQDHTILFMNKQMICWHFLMVAAGINKGSVSLWCSPFEASHWCFDAAILYFKTILFGFKVAGK